MSGTTTQAPNRLTAEDLKNLDIQEVLNGIFSSDVDLKQILRQGIEQIEHTEAIQRRFEEEAAKAIRAHERAIKRAQNKPVNAARVKVAATGSLTVVAGVAAFRLSNPVGWGLLALGAGIRTVKYYGDLQRVKAERELVRRGDVVEAQSEEELIKDLLGESRFETLLGLADTVAMSSLALGGAGAAWTVLAVIQALVTGHAATMWAGSHEALKPDADTVSLPVAFRRPGGKVTHVGRPNLAVAK